MTTLLRPTRHSYSSLKLYKQCPAAYNYRYILKLPDEPTAAMERGTRLHKLCEDYMLDRKAQCHYHLKYIGLKLFNLRERGAIPEQTWLLDKDWEPVTDESKAKLKAIIDVHWLDNDVLRIHDYKSGRPYPEHDDQLEFYALAGLRQYPAAARVQASAIYIDSGRESQPISILREMFGYYAKPWQSLVGQLDSEDQFLPVAGGYCTRCAHRSDKGGPCKEWVNADRAR